ncbi:MAG: ATP-binding protein [Rhizobacter sp.]|nr:ATP-binding protein [Rhizobacter sp.]
MSGMQRTGRVIAIVGAESTGKTTLAAELAATLRTQGHSVALVEEYLREFCAVKGRTPLVHEQLGIAREQAQRIDAAAAAHEIVVADTTALMIAVYSDLIFRDTGLYADAEARQRRYRHTLLTAVDLPWEADGHMRDGAHVREPVTALVRASLARAEVPYAVVSGEGPQRLRSALAAVGHALPDDSPQRPWQWICERCGDADCERHLLARGDV